MIKYYNLPKNFDKFIIQNKNNYVLFLYSIEKYFFINILNLNIYLNYLFILKKKFNKDILNYYFFSWENFILKKIKFKHKITWLYIYRKNFQLLKISTNCSQKIFFYINNLKFKRKKNYFTYHSLILWGLDLNNININIKNIINLLFFNFYTQRGFKLARMKILKKIGKISKYKSLKGKVF